MALIVADRVQETSTTTGTGNFTLDGAATGYRAFSSVLATADTTYYTIADQRGSNWEVGLGTFTSPSTLARTTILSSSNSGSAVNFTAGTKNVFITYPADRSTLTNSSNVVAVPTGGTGAATLTANNVILGNGTSPVQFVAPGTSGNVLTSNGTTWASSTSGWTYLSTVNASGAATADVETTFNSTYDTYALVGNNVTVSSTAQISLRFKTGGSYITTTDYAFALVNNTAASSTLTGSFGSGYTAATFVVTSQASTGTTQFVMYVYNPSSTTITKSVSFSGMNRASSTVTTSGNFNGIATLSSTNGLAALTGVRFIPSAGTISGAFRLYGIKAS